jgi:nucleotide-binding universal stress UspA family protein
MAARLAPSVKAIINAGFQSIRRDPARCVQQWVVPASWNLGGMTMAAFKKILFPTDFSTTADKALAHAVRLADFEGGEVIVQHVVSNYFERYPHWATLFDLHEMQKQMDGYVEAHMMKVLPENTSKVRVRKEVCKGKPAEEIAALAERERVDLVVMGSAKGVVTNKVIRMTNRPVLAVSATQLNAEDVGQHRVTKILVATDFSEHSKRVIEYAFDLKRVFDATIYMLYVIETSQAVEWAFRQGHFVHTMDKMKVWARNQLLNLTPDEFMKDPAVIRLVEAGTPSDTIADVALEVGANLMILGTHEYGTFHTHLIGSTTDELLARTSTSILALKL